MSATGFFTGSLVAEGYSRNAASLSLRTQEALQELGPEAAGCSDIML